MATLDTRISVPAKAAKGQIVDIRWRAVHPMETGYRRDNVGRAIPRNILTRFACTYAGREVFRMDMFTGVSANPFLAFPLRAAETGDLVFTWTDQHGASHSETRRIEVD